MRDAIYYTPVAGHGILPSGTLKWRLGFDEYAHGVVLPGYLRNYYGSVCPAPPVGAPLYASERDAMLGRNPVATSNGDHRTGVGE